MTTHQTRSEERRAVDEYRGGLLCLVLKLDAVASGALGALSLAASPALDDLLGTPLALLVPVGASWSPGQRRCGSSPPPRQCRSGSPSRRSRVLQV
jgi:hypothetical protein